MQAYRYCKNCCTYNKSFPHLWDGTFGEAPARALTGWRSDQAFKLDVMKNPDLCKIYLRQRRSGVVYLLEYAVFPNQDCIIRLNRVKSFLSDSIGRENKHCLLFRDHL